MLQQSYRYWKEYLLSDTLLLDPDIPANQQPTCLPYDNKQWEIPKNNLEFGKIECIAYSKYNTQARVQEFVRGGGAQNLKAFFFFFFCFSIF